MAEEDLSQIAAWLLLPHVARWWTKDTTADAEIARYRQRIGPGRGTTAGVELARREVAHRNQSATVRIVPDV
jgi:hypothetical protein